MSLVGFKARNHPQQTPDANVDDRAITLEDFAPLHARFHFTIDAAATAENARLPRYWTIEDDALAQDWTGERVWCNPPYSNIEPWIGKAHASHTFIVMLLPANRTEQKWWQNAVEPYAVTGERWIGVSSKTPGVVHRIAKGWGLKADITPILSACGLKVVPHSLADREPREGCGKCAASNT